MGIGTVLLVVLMLALVAMMPIWRHSRGWGYGPIGGAGLILAIVFVLLLLGRI